MSRNVSASPFMFRGDSVRRRPARIEQAKQDTGQAVAGAPHAPPARLKSMPNRPARPCRRPGCPELVDSGFCAAHQEDHKQYDRFRGTAASRGYDSDWTRIRLLALKRDNFLCLHCLATKRVTPAIDVDHIEPISKRPELRLVLANLQSLCRACHVVKTKREWRGS